MFEAAFKMSTKSFQRLDSLPYEGLMEIVEILKKETSLISIQNQMFMNHIERHNIPWKDKHESSEQYESKSKTSAMDTQTVKGVKTPSDGYSDETIPDNFVMSITQGYSDSSDEAFRKAPYDTYCEHVKNNIAEEELEHSSKKLETLRKDAKEINNIYLKQIINNREKIEEAQKITNEFMVEREKHNNLNKFDQWLQKQVKHNHYKESKAETEISDYKQHIVKVKKEIEICKLKSNVKPIQIPLSKFKIEIAEKQCKAVMKEREICLKQEIKRKKAVIKANQKAYEKKLYVEECQREVARLKNTLNHLETKANIKAKKLHDFKKKIEALKKKEETKDTVERIGFCDIIAKKQQIEKNNQAIECLMKELNKKKHPAKK